METFYHQRDIAWWMETQAVAGEQSRSLVTSTQKLVQGLAGHDKECLQLSRRCRDLGYLAGERDLERLSREAADYAIDAFQRAALTLDTLRQRGNNDIAHEEKESPPVLDYRFEIILDGRNLPRPVNYRLVRIAPPDGFKVFDWKRPYLIIDPRAGHGAGIGGFKPDSQVGVALNDSHPVYFLLFRRHPEPGQTLADVMRAEAAFVKEIARRHPQSPKPIIIGNCQGGWGAMVLAAANPDITGPLVLNGTPLSYWSGEIGGSPMRYAGAFTGGLASALFLSDIGCGEFDGAHLVSNFEMLNPGRNFFRKYYDLFANIDVERQRFLEFERWWGSFHFLAEPEIRWIVEQLFIGNRLSRGEAFIEHGRQLDLKAIRSPIIVFASFGDNITPPAQALNWIVDTYVDEREIKIRGQRIVYMVHDKVGHLGIFVSSSIARREHREVTSTLKTIETLPPGLYEMTIDEEAGEGVAARFLVSFRERKLADIVALTGGDRSEEADFGAVARLSELAAELYDLLFRPMVRSSVAPAAAELLRKLHPARQQRSFFSDRSPMMQAAFRPNAAFVGKRRPAAPDNPFLLAERLMADAIELQLDVCRDMRDAATEMLFFSVFGSPWMRALGRSHAFSRTKKDIAELRLLPEVSSALRHIESGGFAEAVVRMLILLAESRGAVRRDHLERSAWGLTHEQPFASLGAERRAQIIYEQSLIAAYEPDKAIAVLPALLANLDERRKAIALVERIAGPVDEMEPQTLRMLIRLRKALVLPALPATGDMGSRPHEIAKANEWSGEPA